MSRSGPSDAHRQGVLSIGRLAVGAESYYVGAVAGSEDYYVGSGEGPGQWTGTGSQLLGLSGQVSAAELRLVLAGLDPATEERLTSRTHKVPGFDVTLSAPKSVSLLWAFGGEDVSAKVSAAHDAAVSAALGFLEAEACRVRLGDGGTRSVPGQGFVVAAFGHRVSRAGDPQVHTHLLLANLARSDDGKWRTIDSRRLYRMGRTAGFAYQAHLRWEMCRSLGVSWKTPTRGMAEMNGASERVLRAFSQRRVQIQSAMAKAGVSSPAAAQVVALATRAPKDTTITPAALRHGWKQRAAMVGLDTRRLVKSLTGPITPAVPRLGSTRSILEGLTGDHSSFDGPAVIRAVAQSAINGAPVQVVERHAEAVLGNEGVIALGDGGVFTTTEQIEIESALIEGGVSARHAGLAKVAPEVIASVLDARPQLSPEQRRMVKSLCGDGAGVSVVVGVAGSGKTTALEAARAAWAASGTQVIGAALAGRAAAELQSGSAIASFTIAALLGDLERDRWSLPAGSVLVIDEAAMVGTRTLHRLASQTARRGAKLVLVGDAAQLPEIHAGGAFAALSKSLGAVELKANLRQRDRIDAGVAADLRAGRVTGALETLDRHRRLVTAPSAEALRAAMVSDWVDATSTGQDALMLAVRRVDVEILNRAARGALRERQGLGDDVFVVDGRGYALGDRVLTLRNNARLRVWNGSRATITAIDKRTRSLTVCLDSTGESVELGGDYVKAGWVSHAYASTIHKAQGLSVDVALLWGDCHLFAEAGYTAMTRGRDSNRFYVLAPEPDGQCLPERDTADPRAALARSLRTSRAKTMALGTDPDATELVKLASVKPAQLRARRAQLLARHSRGAASTEDAHSLSVLNKALGQHIGRVEHSLGHNPPPHWRELSGPRPDGPHARARWDAAIKGAARHLVLYGIGRSNYPEGIEGLLGERPMTAAGARSWDEAANRIHRLAEVRVGGRKFEHDVGADVGI